MLPGPSAHRANGGPVRERINLESNRPPVVIPGRVLHELRQHALQAQPEECCGLVSGVAGDRFRAAYRCQNDMTLHHEQDPEAYPRTSREAYYMNEVDYLKALKDAEMRGEHITAVYHSHVGAGAYFSEMDQEYAEQPLFPFPEAAQIVIAVLEDKVDGHAIFERESESSVYVGRNLTPGKP